MPLSILHLFNDWASGKGHNMMEFLLTGDATLVWTIWTSRNDIIFDNSPSKTYMRVLYRGTHLLRFYAQLQRREEESALMKNACGVLETLVMQIFANFGWCDILTQGLM
jgi:hypothetical protein